MLELAQVDSAAQSAASSRSPPTTRCRTSPPRSIELDGQLDRARGRDLAVFAASDAVQRPHSGDGPRG